MVANKYKLINLNIIGVKEHINIFKPIIGFVLHSIFKISNYGKKD